METVVIVTGAIGQPSLSARAARAAGFRIALRDLAGSLDEVVLESPDVVVLELPLGAEMRAVAEAIASPPGMEDVPILALIVESQLKQLGSRTLVADFCLQPFRESELVARIRRLVRPTAKADDDRVVVDELVIDLRGYAATLDGVPIDFAYQEFELLRFLATHPGQAFSRDQLLARVWGHDYYGGPRTVDIHVRRVRAKLGPRFAACLQTIRHVGYKWVTTADEGD
ncbi:MAG: response regulator transcription factor [Deltaproteobacteria bacterium]|nr:MAG: response regulator transcription factor [Deltaproteobacteria bacterium]